MNEKTTAINVSKAENTTIINLFNLSDSIDCISKMTDIERKNRKTLAKFESEKDFLYESLSGASKKTFSLITELLYDREFAISDRYFIAGFKIAFYHRNCSDEEMKKLFYSVRYVTDETKEEHEIKDNCSKLSVSFLEDAAVTSTQRGLYSSVLEYYVQKEFISCEVGFVKGFKLASNLISEVNPEVLV